MDPEGGAMAVSSLPANYQVVQFHLRDPATSAQDFDDALKKYLDSHPNIEAEGALMFSCRGRGQRLYSCPDHDSQKFQQSVAVPLGGFFCDGEISPVGGTTFIHGSTSSIGVFRRAA